jgi:uncharacterized coiled-coil protein SlyX
MAETQSDPDVERYSLVMSQQLSMVLDSSRDQIREIKLKLCQRFESERSDLNSIIQAQAQTIEDLNAAVTKLRIESNGNSQVMDSVRERLARTFGSGQDATRTKHLHTRIILLWRAYAKGKVERKKLYHVARAIYGRGLKHHVWNAWVGYHTGTSRDKERKGSQVKIKSHCHGGADTHNSVSDTCPLSRSY